MEFNYNVTTKSIKKLVFLLIILAGFVAFNDSVFAQGKMSNNPVTLNGLPAALAVEGHTAREEAEGKAVWEKLQAKQITCADLSEENFGTIGEYFMGQMMGTSHESMNNMMIAMMGEKGEEQMHTVMGKRLSGCDTFAAYPSQGVGFMPMMQMMGGWSFPFSSNQSSNNSMMNFGFTPFGGFGWIFGIFMIFWWILIIAGIVALIKWLRGQSRGAFRDNEKSSLDILKERYARGEIDKKEFEDKSREIKNL